jgi:hypothetical protein
MRGKRGCLFRRALKKAMSQTDPTYESPPDASSLPRATPSTRVDNAHVGPRDAASEHSARDVAFATSVPPAGEVSAAALIHQVRTQAAQLATHLQRQQATVDHREAELNARLAAMEHEIRGARLWLNERHADLARQTAELERRESEAAQREQATAENKECTERAAELDRRQAELDAMAERLADKISLAEQVQNAGQAMRAVEARREHLDRAEGLLVREQSQIERSRQLLAEERTAVAETTSDERRKLAEEQQRTNVEQEEIRRELKRQSDELAARHVVLERMRADIARSQQEALETRLATEELWARLCGTMAPASLTQSLAQIRLKLAEEQRLAREELNRQKTEVQALGARLAEQHQKLTADRAELQSWARERQKELEKQAALLVAGNQKIEEERSAFKRTNAEWQSERFALQAEIRKLLRQPNRPESAAA